MILKSKEKDSYFNISILITGVADTNDNLFDFIIDLRKRS